MTEWIEWSLRCYSNVEAKSFKSPDDAKRYAEAHIRNCPQGPMPWATDVEWHETDRGDFVSAANGEWLNHAVQRAVRMMFW